MLINYIRLTLRTFAKNKAAFIINLLGMSIALGLCITAWVNYQYNAEFDDTQENAGNLYRISFLHEGERGESAYGVCPLPVGNLVRENLKDGDHVIQYFSRGGQFRIGDELFSEEFVYADPMFTGLFTMERVSGRLALDDKSSILISDELAGIYFGTTDVIGKTLTQVISGETREFVIAGVYKRFPANSSFRFDLLTAYENFFSDAVKRSEAENDWSRWATTFLYIKSPSSVTALSRQLQQYIGPQNQARPDLKAKSFYIEPFTGMALRAVREKNQGHWLNMAMPPAAVIAPFAMAGFLLLVACFNFMNNAIAVAGNRLKEIGIRKTIGGRRGELIIQFLSETAVFCVLSLVIALVLAEYFVAGWNGMWSGIELTIRYSQNLQLFAVLGILLVATALMAGGYPAFFISAFKPIQIFRGTTRFGGINLLTKSLLVFQFSISLAAVIFAIAFYFNSKFQREFDLGYSWQSVVQVPLDNPQKFSALRNRLESNPLFHSIAGSQHHIYASSYKAAARADNQVEKEVDVLNVGDAYFETVNVRLISGHVFDKDRASDVSESIIVNEEFVRVFDLGEQALGKRMTLNDSTHVYICGVVRDVYLQALFQPLSPLAFRYVTPADYRFLVATTSPDQVVTANNIIRAEWQKLFPNELYPGRLMEERMVMALEHFDSVVLLYTFLGAVAVIMSVSGLYSLVSLNLQKRTKELGIRKILGASMSNIIVQASKLFIIIMIFSFCTGSVLGAVMVNSLMDSVWEYYVAVNFRVLTLAIAILFLIAVATIGFKIRRATSANPVNALRWE